ncbi:MAG: TdeIII family type II restriction endonuclease [Tepidiformaceae bacterium]
MPLTIATEDSIEAYLVQEGRRYIDENFGGAKSAANQKPFHARLMPVPFAAWNQLSERSFSTRSGSWFQQIAVKVAGQFHRDAQSPYIVRGQLKPAARAQVEEILGQLDAATARRKPNRGADLNAVLSAQFPGGEAASRRADLFVLHADGTELFFEMKTPNPNKDTSRAMKRAILEIMAMKQGQQAEAYGSMAYNPYSPDGTPAPYAWNYAVQFLEPGTDLLIARAFWERIGDGSTYDELLDIAQRAGAKIDGYLEQVAAP